MSDEELAVDAIEAALATNEAVRDKLDQIITRKRFRMLGVEQERADVAKLNREIANLRNLLAELRAAETVVSAPTADEIRAVVDVLQQIQAAAVEDAMTQAGLDLIKQGLSAAGELRNKVQT